MCKENRKTIPMLDLVKQYNNIKAEIDTAVQEVLTSGAYINGPQVRLFEENMEKFLNVKHAIGVASGSDALLLSLDALGIKTGDKIIVPTFTFFATAGAVSRLGTIPVFVDIDPVTCNMDLKQVEDLIKKDPKIKAIIPVHLFGLPVDMNRLMELATEYALKVVEDACQAINAEVGTMGTELGASDREGGSSKSCPHCSGLASKAGTIGHTGCFSFFPSKNLGCYGDGGMVVTNDDKIAEKLRILRVHGSRPKYYHSVIGCNSRLDTLQAAILNVKLKYLNEWTSNRRKVATMYNQTFQTAGLCDRQKGTVPDASIAQKKNIYNKDNAAMIHGDWPRHSTIKIPDVFPGHVFHQYVIQVDQRDRLAAYLKEKGINTAIYYPVPLHLQQCFKDLGYQTGQLPHAEQACKKVLALPIDPELTETQIQYIVDSIKQVISET